MIQLFDTITTVNDFSLSSSEFCEKYECAENRQYHSIVKTRFDNYKEDCTDCMDC